MNYEETEDRRNLLRLQREQKQLLVMFAEYCAREGLTWFLTAGSALGAVRHGDVIPWDDDIDVGMLREDYDRLCEQLGREPIPGTFLQYWKSEPGYPLPFAKLRLEGTYFQEPVFAETSFHQGIPIDVFPYDRLPRSALALWCQRAALGMLNLFIIPWPYKPRPGVFHAFRRGAWALARAAQALLPLALPIRAREFFSRMDFAAKGEMLNSHGMYGIMQYRRSMVPLGEVLPTREGQLGTTPVKLPADPEAFLRRLFGDFMCLPPEDQRRPRHYARVQFTQREL